MFNRLYSLIKCVAVTGITSFVKYNLEWRLPFPRVLINLSPGSAHHKICKRWFKLDWDFTKIWVFLPVIFYWAFIEILKTNCSKDIIDNKIIIINKFVHKRHIR